MSKKGLLIVDVQNDFCPGGTLAVKQGDKIIPVLNKYISYFRKHKFPIFASRDWHPKITTHFKLYGGIWPVHCVQNTKGARFHFKLKLPRSAVILSKGMHPKKDSYSAFQAVDKKNQSFERILKNKKINELYVGGLATDYCVKASVLDALRKKLKTSVLTDAIRGVDLKSGDSKKALREMTKSGASLVAYKRLRMD